MSDSINPSLVRGPRNQTRGGDAVTLTKPEQHHLANHLTHITGGMRLWDELEDLLTRQTQRRKPGMTVRSRKPESQLPLHLGAAEAMWSLQHTLAAYTTPAHPVIMARELIVNMPDLVRRDDADLAYRQIIDAIQYAIRMIDLPPEDEITWTPQRLEQANRQVVTVAMVERLAPKLGALGSGLNRFRVTRLVKSGRITPCGDKLYRLGDVLQAHVAAPRGRGFASR